MGESNKPGPEELFAAIGEGDVVKLATLLDRGANPNAAEDEDDDKPLAQAVTYGETEIVKMLIAAGAKVDARDSTSRTPLMLAASMCETGIAKALIAAGAKVDARNEEGETSIFMAAQADDIEMVKMLIAAGANVKARDKFGQSVLDVADDKIAEFLESSK